MSKSGLDVLKEVYVERTVEHIAIPSGDDASGRIWWVLGVADQVKALDSLAFAIAGMASGPVQVNFAHEWRDDARLVQWKVK